MTEPTITVTDMPTFLKGLQLLGKSIGLTASVSDPPAKLAAHPDARRAQQRTDFAWLTTQQRTLERFRGMYIAVHDRKIISCGPTEDLARAGAAKELEMHPDDVLVVPISVPGCDEMWEELKARFGILESE